MTDAALRKARAESMVAIAPNLGEEPFDDPAARVYGETDLVGIFALDFDGYQRCRGDLIPGISVCRRRPAV